MNPLKHKRNLIFNWVLRESRMHRWQRTERDRHETVRYCRAALDHEQRKHLIVNGYGWVSLANHRYMVDRWG